MNIFLIAWGLKLGHFAIDGFAVKSPRQISDIYCWGNLKEVFHVNRWAHWSPAPSGR